jgi:hypothetical protein
VSAPRTATEFCLAVENALGVALEETPDKPLWRLRQIEASKVNRKIKTDPGLYSWENLQIALEYCVRKRINIKSPVAVLFRVEKALAARPKAPRQRPLGELIDEAVAQEMNTQRTGWNEWVGLLVRAAGPARAEVHAEWVQAGRST